MTAAKRREAMRELHTARKHRRTAQLAAVDPDPEFADAAAAGLEDAEAEHGLAVVQLWLAQRP